MTQSTQRQFVSRAGLKLDHALREFRVGVTGHACADFGCNIGGFTDCLLQHGAAKVYAIDTGYGVLAYKLRTDPRVVVLERTNAVHTTPQTAVDLVVIDLAWTPQRHAIPAALRWLKSGPDSRIISLVKPHYELDDDERRSLLHDGRLDPVEAERVLNRALAAMPDLGARPLAHTRSPITGGKSSKRHGSGNVEYLVLLEPLRVT
jgi:23S rRNA (cytidine1920-2'-O)/16S rRNA (cytidine1409-2'-O)-methyltransferase